MVGFYRFLSIALCLFLSIGIPVKLISQNQPKKKAYDWYEKYLADRTKEKKVWESQKINKVKKTKTYTLPGYTLDESSRLYPYIKKVVEDYYGNVIKQRANAGQSPLVFALHFRDIVAGPTSIVVSKMNGSHYKENITEKMDFAGAFVYGGCYFLVTDAVASFLTPMSDGATLTFSRTYTEYDLTPHYKSITTGYIDSYNPTYINFFFEYK